MDKGLQLVEEKLTPLPLLHKQGSPREKQQFQASRITGTLNVDQIFVRAVVRQG